MSKSFLSIPRNCGWVRFTGEELPEIIFKKLEEERAFRSGHGRWFSDLVFYRGDNPETSENWIIIMNDGGYYKVDAEFAFWYTRDPGQDMGMNCVWSDAHLERTVRNFMVTGKTLPDPGYQT